MGLLVGRREERAALNKLLEGARAQHSGVLVLSGEAGVGKTALLEHAIASAHGLRVVRVVGVESEMELAFAAVHQLSAPLLDLLPRLPEAQREALQTAFGLGAGIVPDRFLVGLAVLTLLSEAADQQPLLCVVDDAQWLDRASAQALAFVARRMLAEPIALLFAAREPTAALAGLPELTVRGLAPADARSLLASVAPGRLDDQIANQIIAETRGNPLALLELPRALSPGQLSGGLGLQPAVPGRIEDSFRARLETLPEDTQRLLLLAAAEPTGDPALLWRAAEALGITTDALGPAETAGLIEITGRVVFRHPLVRSALYRSATAQRRREVHSALAQATDPKADPDRRAWHLAEATAWPDETVATELEHAADRAQARGGLAAAAAFLERATALTPQPHQRAQRALAAAQTKFRAGALDEALILLDTADTGAQSDLEHAHLNLLRAQIAFVARRGNDAPPLLLNAARELGALDPARARETYLEALSAAMFAGRFAGPGGSSLDVARAANAAPRPPVQSGPDLLLDGLVMLFTDSYEAAVPILRRADSAFDAAGMPPTEQLRWKWLATVSAVHLWDDVRWEALSKRHVALAREVGALGELPLALSQRVYMLLFAGELMAATSLVHQAHAATEATGGDLAPYGEAGLAALRGHEAEVTSLVSRSRADVTRRGEGIGLSVFDWSEAVLYNGLGRYEQARAAALRVTEHPHDVSTSNWGMVELVEASVRTGDIQLAIDTHRQLKKRTQLTGGAWALGIEARTGALLGDDEAEPRYRQAVELLAQTRMRFDLARAHLLYGEWLRHHRRRLDAREQLHAAHEMFTTMGADGFAARAERELATAGAKVPESQIADDPQLTAQETQIARLAGAGLSNAEIGAQLFISRHTVAYHLRKVFAKLDIASRHQLGEALPDGADVRPLD